VKDTASVRSMRYLYEFRKALKNDDHDEIIRNHVLYTEWQVRPEEKQTIPEAKRAVDRFLFGRG
jgi:hypothetical protein